MQQQALPSMPTSKKLMLPLILTSYLSAYHEHTRKLQKEQARLGIHPKLSEPIHPSSLYLPHDLAVRSHTAMTIFFAHIKKLTRGHRSRLIFDHVKIIYENNDREQDMRAHPRGLSPAIPT